MLLIILQLKSTQIWEIGNHPIKIGLLWMSLPVIKKSNLPLFGALKVWQHCPYSLGFCVLQGSTAYAYTFKLYACIYPDMHTPMLHMHTLYVVCIHADMHTPMLHAYAYIRVSNIHINLSLYVSCHIIP